MRYRRRCRTFWKRIEVPATNDAHPAPDRSNRLPCEAIGRIRFAKERSPGRWLWSVAVNIPGPPYGDARTLDEAKAGFKTAWTAFKDKQDPDKLAGVFAEMNFANRLDRYRR